MAAVMVSISRSASLGCSGFAASGAASGAASSGVVSGGSSTFSFLGNAPETSGPSLPSEPSSTSVAFVPVVGEDDEARPVGLGCSSTLGNSGTAGMSLGGGRSPASLAHFAVLAAFLRRYFCAAASVRIGRSRRRAHHQRHSRRTPASWCRPGSPASSPPVARAFPRRSGQCGCRTSRAPRRRFGTPRPATSARSPSCGTRRCDMSPVAERRRPCS
eukprot:scaffold7052_cov254-Pinguiococcus_pyrenoidosus.AAC.68